MKKIILTIVLLVGLISTAQVKVGSNPTTINANSLLELESTNKGLMLPRVALTATNNVAPMTAATPAEKTAMTGMKVFNTATAGTYPNQVAPGEYYWSGTEWRKVTTAVIEFAPTNTIYVSTLTLTTVGAGSPRYSEETYWEDDGVLNPEFTFTTRGAYDPGPYPNSTYALASPAEVALRTDPNAIYITTDYKEYRFVAPNTYVLHTAAESTTPFFLGNSSTTDAQGNKTGLIARPGHVAIGKTALPSKNYLLTLGNTTSTNPLTPTTGTMGGLRISNSHNGTQNLTSLYGLDITQSKSNTTNLTNNRGLNLVNNVTGSGIVTSSLIGIYSYVTANSTGTGTTSGGYGLYNRFENKSLTNGINTLYTSYNYSLNTGKVNSNIYGDYNFLQNNHFDSGSPVTLAGGYGTYNSFTTANVSNDSYNYLFGNSNSVSFGGTGRVVTAVYGVDNNVTYAPTSTTATPSLTIRGYDTSVITRPLGNISSVIGIADAVAHKGTTALTGTVTTINGLAAATSVGDSTGTTFTNTVSNIYGGVVSANLYTMDTGATNSILQGFRVATTHNSNINSSAVYGIGNDTSIDGIGRATNVYGVHNNLDTTADPVSPVSLGTVTGIYNNMTNTATNITNSSLYGTNTIISNSSKITGASTGMGIYGNSVTITNNHNNATANTVTNAFGNINTFTTSSLSNDIYTTHIATGNTITFNGQGAVTGTLSGIENNLNYNSTNTSAVLVGLRGFDNAVVNTAQHNISSLMGFGSTVSNKKTNGTTGAVTNLDGALISVTAGESNPVGYPTNKSGTVGTLNGLDVRAGLYTMDAAATTTSAIYGITSSTTHNSTVNATQLRGLNNYVYNTNLAGSTGTVTSLISNYNSSTNTGKIATGVSGIIAGMYNTIANTSANANTIANGYGSYNSFTTSGATNGDSYTNLYGNSNAISFSGSGSVTSAVYGVDNNVSYNSTNTTTTLATLSGFDTSINNSSRHAITNIAGIYGIVANGNNNTGNTTNMFGAYLNNAIANSSTITGNVTNMYGLYYTSSKGVLAPATITNSYGLYLNAIAPGVTNTYAIYSNNTADSYLGGSLGIGTTVPSTSLAFGGEIARTIQVERRTAAGGSGFTFSLIAGGANLAATNRFGGDLILSSGTSTGTGSSAINFQTATAGVSGTADNAPTTKMTILGNGSVGIGTSTPNANLHVTGTSAYTTATSGTTSTVVLQDAGTSATFATPTANASTAGRMYIIRNTSTSTNLTVNTVIDFNSGAAANFTLTPAIGTITIICDGTAWYRIN